MFRTHAMGAIIRLATIDDAEACRDIYAPYTALDCPISFEMAPPTIDDMKGRMARVLAQHPWLVCEADGVILGYVYGGVHNDRAAYRWSCNSSVYIRKAAHGTGVGRALYTALFSILKTQVYVNAYAGITLPNDASVGIHSAFGFTDVGVYKGVGFKCGQWLDVVWMHKELQGKPADPVSPIPLEGVLGTPAWDQALADGMSLLRHCAR